MALGPLMLACLLGAGSAALTEVRVMSFNIRTASEWARTHGGDRANGRTWDQRAKGVVSAISTARVPYLQGGLSICRVHALCDMGAPSF